MRKFILLSLAILSLAAAKPAAAAPYQGEFWVSQEQGWVIQTGLCNRELCGYLVEYNSAHAGTPGYAPMDTHNPDPAQRAKPLCGLMLIGGFKAPKQQGADWEGGWVYDPESGQTYSGTISTADADIVKLRGYVGLPLFGKTLILHRATGVALRCTAPTGG